MIQEKKVCIKCKQEKTFEYFSKSKNKKDGLNSICKVCDIKRVKEYVKTIPGLISEIYACQRKHSKKRNHNMPNYTKQEFGEWLLSQINFDILYNQWVKSGYKNELKPSVDRLDDYKGYSFDNIQLITWGENREKGTRDVKSGINNKKSKAVLQYDLDMNFIREFHSLRFASRETGFERANILACCKGINKTSMSFKWRRKE